MLLLSELEMYQETMRCSLPVGHKKNLERHIFVFKIISIFYWLKSEKKKFHGKETEATTKDFVSN